MDKRIIAALGLAIATTAPARADAAAPCPPLLDFRVRDIEGREQNLCAYAGRVVLVVNTASQCGYTPQYKGLQAMQEKYGKAGLVVLGFPANDFAGQEPGSNREIKHFCRTNYDVEFPLFSKTSVRPGGAQPLHEALFRATGVRPGWNFHKYLIARDGARALSFDTRVEPDAPEMQQAIRKLLAEPVPAGSPETQGAALPAKKGQS